ncbi:MAG TPA: S4 domain-containing protein YaaA [Pseudogracilibacillus sp.]|nr:S4 domain-containing protein YaaA [Pseudogracilibacillus sp.]
MNNEKVYIDTPFITLGQMLKLLNIFESGGMIKHFLRDVGVQVNDEEEHRRGRKLYVDDMVKINDQTYTICQK